MQTSPCKLQSSAARTQLDHAERALDAKNQLVVEPIQIVDTLSVTDQRVQDSAQLHQLTPILVGTRQPRGLAAEDHADLTERDTGQQLLEAFAVSFSAYRYRREHRVQWADVRVAIVRSPPPFS